MWLVPRYSFGSFALCSCICFLLYHILTWNRFAPIKPNTPFCLEKFEVQSFPLQNTKLSVLLYLLYLSSLFYANKNPCTAHSEFMNSSLFMKQWPAFAPMTCTQSGAILIDRRVGADHIQLYFAFGPFISPPFHSIPNKLEKTHILVPRPVAQVQLLRNTTTLWWILPGISDSEGNLILL